MVCLRGLTVIIHNNTRKTRGQSKAAIDQRTTSCVRWGTRLAMVDLVPNQHPIIGGYIFLRYSPPTSYSA
jgi:hypothetical protein